MRRIMILLLFLAPTLTFCQDEKEVYPYSDSISVYFFFLDDCKICNYFMPTIKKAYSSFASDQIRFIGLFPNFSSKADKIELFKQQHELVFPLKTDYFKTKAKLFGATIMPEVVVYDEKVKRILYKGRIDNSYVRIGQQRRVVSSFELIEVLTQVKNNEPLTVLPTEAVGCFINFTDNISSVIGN